MNGTDLDRSPAHERVGPQRGRLRSASATLREAVDADREPDVWRAAVGAALTDLAVAWEEHVDFTEAPDGLFDEMLGTSLEVAPEIDHLKRDHVVLRSAVGRAEQLLGASAAGPGDPKLVDALRSVVKQVDGHRRRGADLLYQVYSVDPTGGG